MVEGEFHYIDYDPDETWRVMQRAYIAAGGDVLYPGDEKEMLLRSAHAALTAMLARADNGLKMDTLTYATRDYLKLYGEKRKCYYTEAVAAECTVQIVFSASGIEKEIPAGTEMTADGVVLYALTEPLLQTGTVQTATATVRCTQPGTAGNGLFEGVQLQMLEVNEAIVTITALTDATGGLDAEDEENYRERIRISGLATVTTGPEMMYEAKAMAVSGRILDVKALNDGAGQVGIYLILEDGADEEGILAAVEAACSPKDMRPLTDMVTAKRAEEAAYTLNVSVWQGDAMYADIVQMVENYQKWQDETLGRAFNPDRLISYLYQAGAQRVKFADGDGIDGSLEYREIDARMRCRGTITLEVTSG